MDQVMVALAQARRPPINLCQAGSTFDPFAGMDVRLDLAELRAYAPVLGRPGLRRAICEHYRRRHDAIVDVDRVCVTAGATEALAIAFAMTTRPGGTVVLSASHFPPLRSLAHMFGVRCRFAPVDERGVYDVAQLARMVTAETQAIVVGSPSNPHGAALRADELAAIAELGVPVIFDEVYQALGLTDEPIASAIAVADEHYVVHSFSKALALAGYRVGHLVAPIGAGGLLTDVKATTSFSTSAAGQAVCEALMPAWDPLIAAHRGFLRERSRVFHAAAQGLGVPTLAPPRAGLYGLVDVRAGGRSSAAVALELAGEWGVGTVPGSDFQFPDPGYLRLNLAATEHEVDEGLRRISAYLGRGA